jgi:alkylation response protein AidB-like acyl-CoA dehydrogenase
MDLLPTSDQEQIVDAAKSFLEGEAAIARLRPEHGEIGNNDHALWPQLGELGFWGLAVPEDKGGAGLTASEEFLLYREYGRHLLSLGALGISLGVQLAATRGADDALASMLTGKTRVAIANPRGPVELGQVCSGSWHLLEGRDAEWVVAWSPAGGALFSASQFQVAEDVLAMDSHMTLLRAELPPCNPVAFVPASVTDTRLRALMLIAAYATGISEAVRDQSVEYAKVREQFGQQIGKFQAIKHRCAEMAIRSEVAFCQATYAALAFDASLEDAELHVSAAKLLATDAALCNSADNIQVHGAYGFTSEADAHLFLKRAHTLDYLGGTLREQKSAVLKARRRADPSIG